MKRIALLLLIAACTPHYPERADDCPAVADNLERRLKCHWVDSPEEAEAVCRRAFDGNMHYPAPCLKDRTLPDCAAASRCR